MINDRSFWSCNQCPVYISFYVPNRFFQSPSCIEFSPSCVPTGKASAASSNSPSESLPMLCPPSSRVIGAPSKSSSFPSSKPGSGRILKAPLAISASYSRQSIAVILLKPLENVSLDIFAGLTPLDRSMKTEILLLLRNPSGSSMQGKPFGGSLPRKLTLFNTQKLNLQS